MSKLQKLERKVDALEVPIGAGTSIGVGSTPLWIQELTPLLEFGVLVFAFIIGILTIIVYWKKAFGKKVEQNDS